MASTVPNNFGVCIKLCELIGELPYTLPCQLNPGDLIKIVRTSNSGCEPSIVQMFNRENDSFRSDLYRCDNENIEILPMNLWPFIANIKEGSNGILRFDLDNGNDINVKFHVKFFDTVPSLGAGYFFGLDILHTPNLTEEIVSNLKRRYFILKYGSVPDLVYLRADKLYRDLVIAIKNYSIKPSVSPRSGSKNVVAEKMFVFETPGPSGSQSHQQHMNMTKLIQPSKNSDRENDGGHENTCPLCGIILDNDNKIVLECCHVFCALCLLYLIDINLESTRCPFENKNYKCVYNITVQDQQNILRHIDEKYLQKPDKNFDRVKKELMSPPVRPTCNNNIDELSFNRSNNNSDLQTEIWTCSYCKFSANYVDIVKCVVCGKTNEQLIKNKHDHHSRHLH